MNIIQITTKKSIGRSLSSLASVISEPKMIRRNQLYIYKILFETQDDVDLFIKEFYQTKARERLLNIQVFDDVNASQWSSPHPLILNHEGIPSYA